MKGKGEEGWSERRGGVEEHKSATCQFLTHP